MIEVALSVQFEPVERLGVAAIGALWERFRREFPNTEDKAPISNVTEQFEIAPPPTIEVRLVHNAPPTRCWFINDAGTELIQVQQDRFAFNWRKETDEPYPHYEPVREKFERHYRSFVAYLESADLAEPSPNQCEVTYINHIPPSGLSERHRQCDDLFAPWSGEYSDDFLPDAEDIQLSARFLIHSDDGKPIGRLHVSATPRVRRSDHTPLIHVALTARGAPIGPGLDGVLAFLDLGREYVVRGFTSFTTPKMHRAWESHDG